MNRNIPQCLLKKVSGSGANPKGGINMAGQPRTFEGRSSLPPQQPFIHPQHDNNVAKKIQFMLDTVSDLKEQIDQEDKLLAELAHLLNTIQVFFFLQLLSNKTLTETAM
jgi:hypothetical protein